MTDFHHPSQRIIAIRRSGLLDRKGSEQFGHLTEHVRAALGVPVAIISIVDENRQVFAGHCGLPEPWASEGETPLTHSFCQHVVDANKPLEVRDANIHELVMHNHAIRDIGVVAYLGVPICLPTGEVVGALAAIDTEPRDWSQRDRNALDTLAKVVEKEITVGVSELKYRRLFEDMQEGYYVACAIRDVRGEIVDVLFEDVNPAFGRLTDSDPEKIIGSTLSMSFPHVIGEMLPVFRKVLETGLPISHTNEARALGGRWFENRIRRLEHDRLVSIFADVTGRMTAERKLSDSEAYWRGLFEQLEEGFILGELIRNDKGRVVDWRYKEVNRAWGDLVGIPSHLAFGRTIREVFPGIEDQWVLEFADVVEKGKPSVFTRQVGSIGRWYEGHAQPLGHDTFAVMFVEVTERLRMETELRDRERQLRIIIENMPVGVLLAEAPSGRIVMQNDRVAQILGQDATAARGTDEYGIFVSTYEDGTEVDPKNYPLARVMARECNSAYMEVRFHRSDGERRWVSIVAEAFLDEREELSGAVVIVTDISDRKRAEVEQSILNREMSHRLKNTLSMVQAIATQTLRNVTEREYVQSFQQRIQALSTAHDILLNEHRDEAPIRDVISKTLQRLAPPDRIEIKGPDTIVGPKGTLSLSLLLHELGTNAVKYGSLSNDGGRVAIRWEISGVGEDAVFELIWKESGGPPVEPPSQKGFGSKLINMGLVGAGGVEVNYDRTGFNTKMTASLKLLQHTE